MMLHSGNPKISLQKEIHLWFSDFPSVRSQAIFERTGWPRKTSKKTVNVIRQGLVSRVQFITFTDFFDGFLGHPEHSFEPRRFLLWLTQNCAHNFCIVDFETPTCSLIPLVFFPPSIKPIIIAIFYLPKSLLLAIVRMTEHTSKNER